MAYVRGSGAVCTVKCLLIFDSSRMFSWASDVYWESDLQWFFICITFSFLRFYGIYCRNNIGHCETPTLRDQNFAPLSVSPPQLITCSGEWRSASSSSLVCKTTPDRPGPPLNPAVNTVTHHSFCLTWGKQRHPFIRSTSLCLLPIY